MQQNDHVIPKHYISAGVPQLPSIALAFWFSTNPHTPSSLYVVQINAILYTHNSTVPKL
jgi:hypothetical protein